MRPKIGHQLVLAVGFVSLAVFSVLAYSLVGSHQKAMLDQMNQQADQLTETIKSSTRHAMLQNHPESVHRIIDTIGRQKGIRKVRIFNKEGQIIYSPDKSAVGTFVDKRAEACFNCHVADAPLERLPMQQRTRTFRESGGRRSMGIISPIYNEPACWQAACHAHSPDQSVLGVLDLTMSLEGVDRQILSSRNGVILLTAISILGTSTIIWLLFHFLVGKPVRELVDATQSVGSGDFTYRIDVKRNDELGQLGRSFNEMTQRVTEAQSQLYQSNKLASVGRLAAGIAHELNNPLTGILTFSSLLTKRTGNDEGVRDDLEVIVREAKRCRSIVKGLLDFSRQARPRKSDVDFNQILGRALGIVDHQLSVNNITVVRNFTEPLPAVRVDSDQMIQVLINLLVNASDAIGPNGGRIVVGTDVRERESGRCVRVRVEDSGCGIPAPDLERIFEPFFTTKGTEGTGLGLSVVWGIIHEHDGTITVDSEPGRGTTITACFPIHQISTSDVEELGHERTA
jgi:two-component system NtrC family sensor kinase